MREQEPGATLRARSEAGLRGPRVREKSRPGSRYNAAMCEEELRRHELAQVADAKHLTCQERFNEGVRLSALARRIWLASPYREGAEPRIDEADRRVHLAELGLLTPSDA